MNLKMNGAVGIILILATSTLFGCSTPSKHPVEKQVTEVQEVSPVIHHEVIDVLKKMSDVLANAKTLTFVANTMAPIRGANMQWVHVFTTANVKMERSNKIAIETGGDAFLQKIVFDGKIFTKLAPQEKLYSQMTLPGSIEYMLGQASEIAGESFSFGDVLLDNPLMSWTKGLTGATYVGESNYNGEKLQHLALSGKDLDWEMWLDEKTHLPRMVFVKYLSETRSPTTLIEFSKWSLNKKINPSTFNVKIPKGYKKIELKEPKGNSK